jgi:hypothetical protein
MASLVPATSREDPLHAPSSDEPGPASRQLLAIAFLCRLLEADEALLERVVAEVSRTDPPREAR